MKAPLTLIGLALVLACGACLFGGRHGDVADMQVDGQAVPEFTDELIIADQDVMGLCCAPDVTIYYADYFNDTIGILDVEKKQMRTLVASLRGPHRVAWFGGKLYFSERGTQEQEYHDGRLSAYDPASGDVKVIRDDLNNPDSIFITKAGEIYVLEAGGWATSFEGHDRLVRFRPGSSEYDVIPVDVSGASDVVIDSEGTIYYGTSGGTSPSDLGELLTCTPGGDLPYAQITGLPAVDDIAIDAADNLYIAGFGDDGWDMNAVVFVPAGGDDFVPLKQGLQAWCLCLDNDGNILYSTGRHEDSIRILRRK